VPFDGRRRPAEFACVRSARALERCAQQTSGFMHYVALMRAGSLWGVNAAWQGQRSVRGRVYTEKRSAHLRQARA